MAACRAYNPELAYLFDPKLAPESTNFVTYLYQTSPHRFLILKAESSCLTQNHLLHLPSTGSAST